MTKKEILIVEDEDDIRSLLKKFLEERNFSVTMAEDGRSAADILQNKNFDLLIIDILLPGEHGIDLVKMKGNNFITPIILVSGIYDENEIKEIMKDPDVKYFVKKPFDLNDLYEKINAAINADKI
ncbi:MAG: response regulator [Acidobacteriota bacterium]